MRSKLPGSCRVKKLYFVVLAVLLSLSVAVFGGCGSYIRFRVKYHLVYCCEPSVERPASDLCASVKDMGYAGYVIEYGGMYYIAAAIESTSGAASDLAGSLSERGLKSGVVTLERINFELETYHAEQNARQYEYTLETLDAIVTELRNCVHDLVVGDGEEARPSMRAMAAELYGLAADNTFNCFTAKLAYISALSSECAYGALLPRDVRCLIVAVVDCIISVRLT